MAERRMTEVPVPEARVRLLACVHEPDGDSVGGVVVWPAMGVAARHYDPLADALAERGFLVVVVDLPGQGRDRHRITPVAGVGYHALAAWCAPALADWARERLGSDRVHHLGHSLGGHIALLHAARAQETVAGVILVASGTPHRGAFPLARRVGITAGVHTMRAVTRMTGHWPGHRLGFGGRQSRELVDDWTSAVLTGRFTPAGADLDYERALRSLRTPVLAVAVAGDRLAPRPAVERLCAKIPAADLERVDFDTAGPLDHFRWTRHADTLAPRIAEWLGADRLTP